MLAFCLGFFGLALLTSMTAMDVASTLMGICLVYQAWRWHQLQESENFWNPVGFDWLFLVWFLVVGVGFALIGDPNSNWAGRLIEFKWIFLLYVFITVFIQVRPTEKIMPWVNGILIICAIYSASLYFIDVDPFYPNQERLVMAGGYRTGGFFGNPMTFAHSYGQILCWVFAVYLYQWRWKLPQRWWTLLASVAMAAAVLLSFTRGVWIGVICAALLMSFMFRFGFGILMTVFGSAAAFAMLSFWDGLKDRAMYVFDQPAGYDIERVYIWKANIEMWKDHPLFGVGYGESSKLLPEYLAKVEAPFEVFQAHAHNQYLHFLSGTGAIGLLVYVLVLLFFLVLSFRVWKRVSDRDHWHKSLILGAIGAQVVFIVGGMTEANIEHSKVRYVAMMTWAIVVWLAYENNVLKKRI